VGRWQPVVGVVSAVALLLSLSFAKCGWSKGINCNDCGHTKIYQAVVIVAWTLVPPIWFLLEYTFLFPRTCLNLDKDTYKDKLDRFKYQQDLASKIWLAVVSALLILYFWKDLGRL
jgi:hypothetical protein